MSDGEETRPDIHAMHDPIMREMERPRDGYQPVPLTLIFLFFALTGWGGWYLGTYSGDWRADVFYPGQEEAAPSAAEEEPAGPEQLAALGERVYSQCAACHQRDGRGIAGSFPPLDGSRWVTGAEGVPIRILLHGLSGPIEVAGVTYNQQMPAWGEQLSDRQIAAVVTYIRSAWSNDAPAVDPSSVERIRSETDGRTIPWTATELQRLQPAD